MLKKIGGLQLEANWINDWKNRPILLRMLNLKLSWTRQTFFKANGIFEVSRVWFEFVLAGLGFEINIYAQQLLKAFGGESDEK